MPLTKIVVASWLKKLAEERFEESVLGPVPYGVNFQQFFIDNAVLRNPKQIGMLYHSNPAKGVTDGLEAIALVRHKHPDIRLVMFGTRRPKFGLPSDVVFYKNPPQQQLRRIYSSCAIWLAPSWAEGCHLTPMEAMACGCAVVATDIGGIQDYVIPGKTALLSPPRDPEAMAHNIIRLLDNETLLHQIATAGHNHIRTFTWERAAKQMETFFVDALALG